MTIEYMTGNIFDSEAEALVNTVNCEGYMGKGIAYQFKLRYPENNEDYVRACKNAELRPGTLHWFKEQGKVIINSPRKIDGVRSRGSAISKRGSKRSFPLSECLGSRASLCRRSEAEMVVLIGVMCERS